MITINKKFKEEEIALLKNLIGKKIVKIKHDEFWQSNSVYLRVSFYTDDGKIYQLKNKVEGLDFLWGPEDVAVFSFKECEEKDTGPFFTKGEVPKIISTPINLEVKDIVIINDKVKAYDGNNQFGEYDYVKGIIVKFEGFEYLFHRSIWFSDDIIVDRGTETVERLSPIDEDWGDWSKPRHSVNTREFISLINLDN